MFLSVSSWCVSYGFVSQRYNKCSDLKKIDRLCWGVQRGWLAVGVFVRIFFVYISHTQRNSNFTSLFTLNKVLFSGYFLINPHMQDILESSLCTMEKAIFTYSVIELNSLMGKNPSWSMRELLALLLWCVQHTLRLQTAKLWTVFSPDNTHFHPQNIPLVKNLGFNFMFCIPWKEVHNCCRSCKARDQSMPYGPFLNNE